MTTRFLPALAVFLAAIGFSFYIRDMASGQTLVFALFCGLALGFVFQRSRFCFYCHARDWFEDRNPRGVLSIILAIAIGLIIYTIVLSSWMPNPQGGSLPPDIHIGPVSWVLVIAGLAFGLGMVISGSCISAHWYRLSEGSAASPFALVGTAIGFALGFMNWNQLYSLAVAEAPVVWLPAHFGYGGALVLQLAALAILVFFLWRSFAGQAKQTAADVSATVPSLKQVIQRIFTGRWDYWIGGLIVGIIGAIVIIRMKPLGVTAMIGSQTRAVAQEFHFFPMRLEGLDLFAGCATLPEETWMTPNAILLVGIIFGSFVAALASGQWKLPRINLHDSARGLVGGVLLGWGAMIGLGCSIGTLLSGSMAGALSGWVFGAAMFIAIWLGLKIKARFAF